MTDSPRRRGSSWTTDALGGIRAIGLEALIVVVLAIVAVVLAFVAVTVV